MTKPTTATFYIVQYTTVTNLLQTRWKESNLKSTTIT